MNNLEKTQEIKNRLVTQNKAEIDKTLDRYYDAQTRLKKLVKKHGTDHVSLASGLKIETLKQYINLRVPPAINMLTVEKAENVLKGL